MIQRKEGSVAMTIAVIGLDLAKSVFQAHGDAEAICEAVQRPSMRFVPTKTIEQQAILMAHRTRSLLVRQRTMAANALRAHLAEFGLVAVSH